MKTGPIFNTTPIFLIAAMLSVAACSGGGGGGGTGQQMPGAGGGDGTPTGGGPPPISERPDFSGIHRAATAVPRFGRRSVTQSSSTDGNNVTTDAVDALFDRGQFTISVTREDGTHFQLDSSTDAVATNSRTPIRRNQITGEWTLEERLSGNPVTVYSFGEIPNREFPLRAIRAAGNYGTNKEAVDAWEASGRTAPLVPMDYINWLKGLHVNQVGLSVALLYDDSMDSTVERVYSGPNITTFSDDAIRQFIREFRKHGIDVYLTLAFESEAADIAERPVFRWQLGDPGDPRTGVPHFGNIRPENWPWRPDHPDHERFVAEFWQSYADQAVHFAQIAQEEGVRMFSLGTETENLFRTRSGGNYWPNHFRQELQSMVRRVREVYSGIVTYDMHYTALTQADHFGTGSHHLWEDLGLDIVGVSAYFEMTDTVPSAVISVSDFEKRYDEIFQEYLIPLAARNPGLPIVFLEYGVIDTVESPAAPGVTDFRPFVFQDADGNGLDDGREMQANMYQALINTMERYPGLVDGILWTENWIASDQKWAEHWGGRRGWSVRDKLSENVVRTAYESWGEWLTGGHWMRMSANMDVDEAGAFVDAPELAGTPSLPTAGTATYQGLATGGYALVYGSDFADISAGSHEVGEYNGDLELTADFLAGRVSGRVHSIEVDGLHTPHAGGTRPITGVSVPYEITLEPTNLSSQGFTGETLVQSSDPDHNVVSSSGTWGGKFSSISDSDDNPRMIAGTHGARFTSEEGTEGSFIGVFVGVTGE